VLRRRRKLGRRVAAALAGVSVPALKSLERRSLGPLASLGAFDLELCAWRRGIGGFARVLEAMTDVTTHPRTKAALAENEARPRELLVTVGLGAFMMAFHLVCGLRAPLWLDRDGGGYGGASWSRRT
jgi:hypothetical protein